MRIKIVHILPWMLLAVVLAASGFIIQSLLKSKEIGFNPVKENSLVFGNVDSFKTESGKPMAENRVVKASSENIEAFFPELKREISELKVKLNKVEALNRHVLGVNQSGTVALRDSIIFDTVQVRVFDFSDGYFSISGLALGDTQSIQASYQDTLTQVVFRGRRKKPWLWIFSPRELTQRITLKNPNARVIYSESIQVK